MYPSIKFTLVNKAISYFTINLPKTINPLSKLCLSLIAFRMSSTILKLEEKYFECGEKGTKEGLAIGRYKSNFLWT